jgi:VanZ family protein
VLLVSLYVLFWPNHPGGSTHLLGADKVVHALLFGALAATARWRFGGRAGVLAAVVAYAAGSELVQALLLSTRSGDVWDLVADALGALAGWLLAGRRPLS